MKPSMGLKTGSLIFKKAIFGLSRQLKPHYIYENSFVWIEQIESKYIYSQTHLNKILQFT